MKTEDSKMKYTEAASELEQIVQDIENAEISVDELSEKVKRAAELIHFCNKKLTQTEEDVQKVLDDISPLAKS
ncbi:MAG: exodeoxyribonuclease VII small subunit [Bacteroidales bacterium]|nr:exodeoxyribonuclease VII small subunit [Bacteroidales bacterium]MDY0215662.1 exodeoxyribonuclease VII small subunit [Bacteroidales bacterium]